MKRDDTEFRMSCAYRLELFQIWLNLPAASKMVEPHFKMLWSEQLLHHTISDAGGKKTVVTTVAGNLHPGTAEGPQPSPPPNSYAASPDCMLHQFCTPCPYWQTRVPG